MDKTVKLGKFFFKKMPTLGGDFSGLFMQHSLDKVRTDRFLMKSLPFAMENNFDECKRMFKNIFPEYEGEMPYYRDMNAYHWDDVQPISHAGAQKAAKKALNSYREYCKRVEKQVGKELSEIGFIRDATKEQVGNIAYGNFSPASTIIDIHTMQAPAGIRDLNENYYIVNLDLEV